MTSERVIVLFFFCADLAIRSLSESATEIFHNLMQWIQKYIVQKLCVWVQEHGGWVRMTTSVFIFIFVQCNNVTFFNQINGALDLKIY